MFNQLREERKKNCRMIGQWSLTSVIWHKIIQKLMDENVIIFMIMPLTPGHRSIDWTIDPNKSKTAY